MLVGQILKAGDSTDDFDWCFRGAGLLHHGGMGDDINLRTVDARRYVTPLKEGGSLPALMEASDDGTWVVNGKKSWIMPGCMC